MQFKIEKLGKELGNRCLVSIYRVFTAGRVTSWVFLKKVWNSVPPEECAPGARRGSEDGTRSAGPGLENKARGARAGGGTAPMGACRKRRLTYMFRLAILGLSTRISGLGRLQKRQPGSPIIQAL